MKPANLAASEVFLAQIFKKSVRYISRNRANLEESFEIRIFLSIRRGDRSGRLPDRTGPPPIFKKAHPVGVLEDSYPCRNEKAGLMAGSCWRVFQFFTTEPLR